MYMEHVHHPVFSRINYELLTWTNIEEAYRQRIKDVINVHDLRKNFSLLSATAQILRSAFSYFSSR